ncbi:MAG: NAD(P)H-dependent oxidoreductase [Tetrasphaera sp.]
MTEPAEALPRLMIIIGSTRPGRAGLPIGTWFAERARAHGGFQLDVVDLAELGLPFLDEPHHPRLHEYENDHTREWSERVSRADAIVIVTAEYNYGYPAPLKNAIDYLHNEWFDKPVGFVSYGGVSAGTRAVQQLKQVVGSLRMVPVTDSVNIPFFPQFLRPDGSVEPNEVMVQSADAMLDELLRLEKALRAARANRPVA